jgi:hypothetical protein
MLKYILNLLLSLDQFINVLFCGDPDETISSRVGKRHAILAKIVDTIFFFDKRHSYNSREIDEGIHAVPLNKRWQVSLVWIIIIAYIVYEKIS